MEWVCRRDETPTKQSSGNSGRQKGKEFSVRLLTTEWRLDGGQLRQVNESAESRREAACDVEGDPPFHAWKSSSG
ncbi:unnamed protein product [Linum tenue]|uniref:Uncharacterized protein n=1 Tax=Linum tenue TaxID=586396 RepID=A0AAV0NFT9_9ROSI|nr:unnamed protein product [Linum tenue]